MPATAANETTIAIRVFTKGTLLSKKTTSDQINRSGASFARRSTA
jgi:hypothetical protein